MESDLNQLIKKYKKYGDIYNPVVLHDKIYYEYRRRKYKAHQARLDLFPDFKGESIVDIGCNTGFNLIQLKKHHGAGPSLGLDRNRESLNIAEFIKEKESVSGLEFSYFSMDKIQYLRELPEFDNYLFLSITSLFTKHYDLDFDFLIRFFLKKAKKNLYVEPTNHEKFTKEEYKDIYMKYFSTFGNTEFLGYTFHQNRGMFKISLHIL